MDNQKLTIKQVNLLKENIDKMSRSDEQFIFMIFKNPNGTDNITHFGWNMVLEKLDYYLGETINSAKLGEASQ